MGISYPDTIDSLTNPNSTDTLDSPSHSEQHSDANDAIEALEAKVGTDSSTDTSSVDYKLTNASSSNPGHLHTGSSLNIDTSTTTDITGYLYGDGSNVQSGKVEYSVEVYGATGDGSTDDTAAIQSAVDAANTAGGGVVSFPAGTYIISDTIDLYSNILLKGEPRRTIIDFSDYDTVGVNFYAFQAEGSLGGEIALTGNASILDTTLDLTTAGISADDYLLVYADTRRISTDTVYAGEFVRVKEITDGSSLELYNDLQDDYVTADNAAVKKATFKENIAIEGIDFKGSTNASVTSVGINLLYCRNVKVRNCSFESTMYIGIRNKWVVESNVTDCNFLDIVGTGLGYGVHFGTASQDCIVSNCFSNNVGNFVAIGAQNNEHGLIRRIHVSGNVITNSKGSGFDAHDSADDIHYSNNTISGYSGFNIRCKNVNISNNTVDCYYQGMIYQPLTNLKANSIISNNIFKNTQDNNVGINVVQGTNDYGDIESLVISGNVIEGGKGNNIYVQVNNNLAPARNIVISNNTMVGNTEGGGMRVFGVEGGAIMGNSINMVGDNTSGIYLSANVSGMNVSGNYIDSASSTGTNGIRLAGGTDCQITGNRVDGCNYGLLQDNSTTYSIVMGNNFRGNSTAMSLGSGAGHISETAASDAYNIT